MRSVAAVFCFLLAGGTCRAEALPTFMLQYCNAQATDVLVVNKTGEVLETWRGDCRVGTRLPINEFKLKFEHAIPGGGLNPMPAGRVTGNRLILFLNSGGARYPGGMVVKGWSPADNSKFDVSTIWVEDGKAYAIQDHITRGNLAMTPVWFHPTEAAVKEAVEKLNAEMRIRLEAARGIAKTDARALELVEIVIDAPGVAPVAFANLIKCGTDALPALRSILSPKRPDAPAGFYRPVKADSVGEPVLNAVYRTMAALGEPACTDLVGHLKQQLTFWTERKDRLEWYPRLEANDEQWYHYLVAATSNPAAFAKMTDAERAVLLEFRKFWVGHPYLSTLGKEGDRIYNRFEKAINAWKK